MARWYVMYTKPRQEEVALDNLQRQNYTVFYPQARLQKRKAGVGNVQVVEPLFPRYMFLSLEQGVDDFSRLRSTRGCVDLVKFGGIPSTVPDGLVQLIQSQADDSFVLNLTASPPLAKGSTVRVAEGPFEGLMGQIVNHRSEQRVFVLLNVLGGERSVELKACQLEAV